MMPLDTGDFEEVMRFVQEDSQVVDSNDGEQRRWTALHYASLCGHVEVACYLLDQGADINARSVGDGTHLYLACREDHPEVVELLMSRGADPTITTNVYRWTPFMIAAICGHVAVVRHLLRIRALRAVGSTDARSTRGETALWKAACEGHVEVVKLLVEPGATIPWWPIIMVQPP